MTDSSAETSTAAVKAETVPQSETLWDKLPREIQVTIIDQSDLFTRIVNGRWNSSVEVDDQTRRAVWLHVLDDESDIDLALLPDPPVYSSKYTLTNADLGRVKSRSMYERLCERLPKATENNMAFLYIDGVVSRTVYFNNTVPTNVNDILTKHHLRLLYIPMRHCWLDLLEDSIKFSPYARFNDAIVEGYTDLYNHLSKQIKTDHIKNYACIDSQEMMKISKIDSSVRNGSLTVESLVSRRSEISENTLAWAARCGRLDVVKYCIETFKLKPSTQAVDWAAKYGRFDIIKWVHENSTCEFSSTAIDMAVENDHLDIVRFLLSIGYDFYYEAAKNCKTEEMARMLVNACCDNTRMNIIHRLDRDHPSCIGYRVFQQGLSFN